MSGYEFRECEWPECRFRFPVEIDGQRATRCPRCGAAAVVVSGPAVTAVKQLADRGAPSLSALLDNIRSIHNVGSMFRTADGAGLDHLYLAGMTATPAHPKLGKAALGAQGAVDWSYGLNGVILAQTLKEQGHRLWAIEAVESAESFFDAHLSVGPQHVTFVVGNERAGIDPGILALCDRTLSLPMTGRKNSLNVAVTFGIVSYHLRFHNENNQ